MMSARALSAQAARLVRGELRLRRPRWLPAILVGCVVTAWAVACSSDDDDQRAGIEGTGVSDGSDSGFGSVFVNGVEFDTDGAEIIVDGARATEDALRVGMILRVTGEFDADGVRGRASRVEFDRRLAGPVEEIAAGEGRIKVLGQTVRVDANAVFVGASLDSLQLQDFIEVSGFPKEGDEILATLVERSSETYAPGQTQVDVEGIVRDLMVGSCRIGDLTVDYTTALLDIENGPLENGAIVEAVGVQPEPGGRMFASRMTVKNPTVAASGERVELSGLIAGFSGLGDFDVRGQWVDASRAVRTDDAPVSPANDVRIEVEGTIDDEGRLVADSFALRPPSDVRIVGTVESVDGARFVISGTTVEVEPSTQYEDLSAANLRTFRVDDLEAGDTADVRGFRDAAGNLVATRVVRLGSG